MLDPRISFKNRWLAGVLAFLLPGGGHLYQGRWFKGTLCAVCILATFFIGMDLGDWSVVYWKRDPTNLLNPFYAQVFVGLPALPSLVQSRRYESRQNVDEPRLDAPLRASFDGVLKFADRSSGIPDGSVTGTIALEPDPELPEGGVRGQLEGTLRRADGGQQNVKLNLGHGVRLGKPVSADPERLLETGVLDAGNRVVGEVRGNVPRAFWDRFEAPPDEDYYLDLHRRLGKFHELALTFTMIAGLLNILVILDAIEGPAYGYGDEEESLGESKPAAGAQTTVPGDRRTAPSPPVRQSENPSKVVGTT